jgi:hypothetical protein
MQIDESEEQRENARQVQTSPSRVTRNQESNPRRDCSQTKEYRLSKVTNNCEKSTGQCKKAENWIQIAHLKEPCIQQSRLSPAFRPKAESK